MRQEHFRNISGRLKIASGEFQKISRSSKGRRAAPSGVMEAGWPKSNAAALEEDGTRAEAHAEYLSGIECYRV
jgi:hypothetical protein